MVPSYFKGHKILNNEHKKHCQNKGMKVSKKKSKPVNVQIVDLFSLLPT